jgi:hypothetical protein
MGCPGYVVMIALRVNAGFCKPREQDRGSWRFVSLLSPYRNIDPTISTRRAAKIAERAEVYIGVARAKGALVQTGDKRRA